MEEILAHASLYMYNIKTKDDLRMRFNIDSLVQLLTLFTCLLFMEMDLSCPQPSNCPVM